MVIAATDIVFFNVSLEVVWYETSFGLVVVVLQSLSHIHSLWPHGLQHARPPVLHYLLEFAEIHVHSISAAISPSHPLPPPSPFPFSLSQHEGLFHWFFHGPNIPLSHSSILAWRIPGMGAWWAAVYGVARSRTRLTWLSSSNIPFA